MNYQYPSFNPPYNAYSAPYNYELKERQNGKFAQPLLTQGPSGVIVENSARSCTDIICAILMFLFIGAFIGLLIYGCVKGSGYAVISVYNYDGLRCNQQPGFYYGYLPHLYDETVDVVTKFADAVCVSSCPTSTTVTTCLNDGKVCAGGAFTPEYASFPIAFYCIPEVQLGQVNIQSIFSFNLDSIGTWLYDLEVAWVVLVSAAGAAVVLSIIFFLFVRCCAGPIIWLAIIVFVGGMITIGVFFILQAKGVTVPDYISASLSSISYNTLIIVGSCLLGGSVLVLLIVICLRSRISMGAKAVQLGSIFLFQNCCLVILPVTQAILVFGTFVAMVVGSSFIYSLGDLSLPNNSAFAIFSLPTVQIVLLTVYISACLWMIFFFNGCNHFMLSSAVAVWYFNSGSPCGDSLHRLARFHSGSVALTSLINALFFIIKMLANIFSFDVKDDDSRLVSCCLKFLNALFCIFKLFMRFLSEGTYVQIAIAAQGYCTSTFKAFDIIANNAIKVTLTDGLSIFFTILGVLGITLGIAVGAYFSILYIPYYQQRINDAFIITLVSALIAFVISAIYLSMIDVSASSVLQCYFVDHEASGGRIRYGNESVKQILKGQ